MRTIEEIDADLTKASEVWTKYGNLIDALRKERKEVESAGKTASEEVVEAKSEIDSLLKVTEAIK